MNSKKQFCFNIDENLLTEFKIQAVKNHMTQTDLIIKYMKQGLESEKNQE